MKAFRGGLFGCFGVGVAIIIVIVVIAALANAGKSGGSSSSSSGAPKTAKVLLDKSGNGQWTSPKFTTQADDWSLTWSYDCAAFGTQGNFIVSVVGSDGLPRPIVNEIGAKRSDVTEQHSGGTVYLEISSECAWTVQAKG